MSNYPHGRFQWVWGLQRPGLWHPDYGMRLVYRWGLSLGLLEIRRWTSISEVAQLIAERNRIRAAIKRVA
jgi:hypothetical protein